MITVFYYYYYYYYKNTTVELQVREHIDNSICQLDCKGKLLIRE